MAGCRAGSGEPPTTSLEHGVRPPHYRNGALGRHGLRARNARSCRDPRATQPSHAARCKTSAPILLRGCGGPVLRTHSSADARIRLYRCRMSDKQVWFITGAGRGLGVDIARAALVAGHPVVATARKAESVTKALGEDEH